MENLQLFLDVIEEIAVVKQPVYASPQFIVASTDYTPCYGYYQDGVLL